MDWEKMLVNENITVIEAMENLNEVATKVLFVHKDKKLLASLSDGDVRRWILAKGSLKSPIREVANYNVIYSKSWEKDKIEDYMDRYFVEAIPIVDDNMCIIGVKFWRDVKGRENLSIKKINLPVVMMAGGKGTRLYPYTQILPKPLIPIGEIPIAEHIINQFKRWGCEDFYMIVNHKKNMIKAYFNEINKDYNIFYEDEEKPLGTGGGLSLLKGKVEKTFILTNCDILIREDFAKIYKLHKEQNNLITMICSLKNFQIPYGVVDIAEEGEIVALKEKPTLSFFTNTGCYFVEPKVIYEMEENKEISFPDIIKKYMLRAEKVGVYPIAENAWLDMGQIDELEKMKKLLEQESGV